MAVITVASKFCNCDVILDNVALLLSLVATSEFCTLTSTVRFALAVMLASDSKYTWTVPKVMRMIFLRSAVGPGKDSGGRGRWRGTQVYSLTLLS